MLRSKELNNLLKRELAEVPCITNIMLVTVEGGILAAVNKSEAEQTAAAVLASVYTEYVALSPHLTYLLGQCQNARIAMTTLCRGALVLCVLGSLDAPYGLLDHKMKVLEANLEETLKPMYCQ
eukprot:GDKJ01016869.1.p1 GENE.GDKJ01016869.1~~GDKJ01016869.1.p1  ORF type:complete len:123 (-),score=23.94 GDKJ01016869.1:37-405(-)